MSRSSPTPAASSTRTRRRRRSAWPPSSSRRAPICTASSRASTKRCSSRRRSCSRGPSSGCEIYEGGRVVVTYLAQDRFRGGRSSGAVLRGNHRPPAGRSRAPSSPALIREPPRTGGPCTGSRRARPFDELDVSKIARASGGGHRQAAGFSSDESIDAITEFVRREFAAQRATPVA